MVYQHHIWPIRALYGVISLALVLSSCATHADFVEVRQELRTAAKAQKDARSELRQQFEELEHRIQSLEVVQGGNVSPTVSTMTLDKIRLNLTSLEERIAHLETTQPVEVSVPEPAAPPRNLDPVEPEPVPSPPLIPPRTQSRKASPRLSGISPTSAFNLAYNDYLNGKYELAIIGFHRYLEDFPDTSLAPNSYYWLGESYFQRGDFIRAIKAFEHVVHEYPDHGKVPASLYKIGISAEETGDSIRARSNLTRVIEEYSTSNEANLAKNKLAEIR